MAEGHQGSCKTGYSQGRSREAQCRGPCPLGTSLFTGASSHHPAGAATPGVPMPRLQAQQEAQKPVRGGVPVWAPEVRRDPLGGEPAGQRL